MPAHTPVPVIEIVRQYDWLTFGDCIVDEMPENTNLSFTFKPYQFEVHTNGVLQVNEAAGENNQRNHNFLIVSSDFRRARESPEIMYRLLACDTPGYFDERLRERHFGELESGDATGHGHGIRV